MLTPCASLARRILNSLTPGFYGDVVISVKAGKVVNVKIVKSEQPDGEVEVIELFRQIVK